MYHVMFLKKRIIEGNKVFKNIQHIFDDLVLDLSTNKKMARSFRFVFFRKSPGSRAVDNFLFLPYHVMLMFDPLLAQ